MPSSCSTRRTVHTMAVCRRRSTIVKALVVVPLVWVTLLLFFFVDHQATTLEKLNLARRAGVVQRLMRPGGAKGSAEASGAGDSNRLPARQPKTAEPSAPAAEPGGEQRGFLLPPQELSGPGEMGKPVKLDVGKLPKDTRDVVLQGWSNNAFNQYVSDMISVHRTLPDVRDDK